MKANKWIKLGQVVVGVAVVGLAISMARADSQADPFTQKNGGSPTNACPGVYYGYAKMTNSTGTFWITPPTNTTSGTFTDTSGFPPPYTSSAIVGANNMATWCNSNSVTFPVTNGLKYAMTVYVTSTPPPTNGQPIQLQITWQ